MSHKIMYCYVRLSKCQALNYKFYISCLITSAEFLPNCMHIHFCYFNKRKEVKQFTSHTSGHELENVKAKFEASHSGQNDSRHRASGRTKPCHWTVLSLPCQSCQRLPAHCALPLSVFWRTQWRLLGSICCINYGKNIWDHRQGHRNNWDLRF